LVEHAKLVNKTLKIGLPESRIDAKTIEDSVKNEDT
jgi:hypothetical protein